MPGAHTLGALMPGAHTPGALMPGAHTPGALMPGAHPDHNLPVCCIVGIFLILPP
jgi:hypothetical protein